MAEVQEKTTLDLSADQKIVLRDIFQYRDTAEYTEADLEAARKMFDTPEKFALLRKIFQVLTPDERGITMPDPRSFVETESAQKYVFDMAVTLKVDETIRQMLVQFYRVLRGSIVDLKKKEFEADNQEAFDEQKGTEEYDEAKAEEKRIVGDNL